MDDAADVRLDNVPYVLFLFNPFDDVIMSKFLVNNIKNLKRNRSYICYANHRNKNVLEELNLTKVFSCEDRKLSIWQC